MKEMIEASMTKISLSIIKAFGYPVRFFSSETKKLLFWFYRQHEPEVIDILKAISQPYDGVIPVHKSSLLSYLVEKQKIKHKEDGDKFIKYLKNAGYISLTDKAVIGLTEKGRKLLSKYEEFWLLRPMKIVQNALKENLTAIISLLALIVAVVSVSHEKSDAKIVYLEPKGFISYLSQQYT